MGNLSSGSARTIKDRDRNHTKMDAMGEWEAVVSINFVVRPVPVLGHIMFAIVSLPILHAAVEKESRLPSLWGCPSFGTCQSLDGVLCLSALPPSIPQTNQATPPPLLVVPPVPST